ncbi:hypothetical protein D3C76_1660610 [compost metagenome]
MLEQQAKVADTQVSQLRHFLNTKILMIVIGDVLLCFGNNGLNVFLRLVFPALHEPFAEIGLQRLENVI